MRGVLDLRGGANDLEIDRGRQEKKPRAERICKICKDGVEDEFHVSRNAIPRAEERSAGKLKLNEPLEIEQFVELIGSNEKNKTMESDWTICGCDIEPPGRTLDSNLMLEQDQMVSDN